MYAKGFAKNAKKSLYNCEILEEIFNGDLKINRNISKEIREELKEK